MVDLTSTIPTNVSEILRSSFNQNSSPRFYMSFFFKIILFIYFWLCWLSLLPLGFFSGCIIPGRLSGFSAWASPVAEHRLWGVWASGAPEHRLSSCAARVSLLHAMWDLPRSGIEPMSPTYREADSLPQSHQGSPAAVF